MVGAVRWTRQYSAMLATPLHDPRHHPRAPGAITLRVALASTCFVVIMVLFGAATSWTVVLALPAAVLGGVTIAAPVAAYTVTLDNDLPLAALLRFGIMPMFLFSGTFFPISQLPWWLEVLAWVLPLWHGGGAVPGPVAGDDLGRRGGRPHRLPDRAWAWPAWWSPPAPTPRRLTP